MKKTVKTVLSLALSLTLTLSLSIPVSAAAAEPADDLFETSDIWVEDDEIQTWIKAHPVEVAAFDADAYYKQEYTYYGSKEEYPEWHELTEETFRDEMLREYVFVLLMEEKEEHYRARVKEQLGGAADGLNVMVNGKCVTFPDARPEARNQRVMVPLTAIMEHLGAEVTYNAVTAALVKLGDFSFTHKIGTDTMTTGDGQTITMDVASYAANNRTMVPVSFARALGYEVAWDQDYQAAVLVDRQAMADQIDGQFTLLNRMLHTMEGAGLTTEGQSVKTTLELDMALTLLDSLNGDKTMDMTMSGSGLSKGTAAQVNVELDMGDLFVLLMDEMDVLDEEEMALLEQFKDALSKTDMELLMDLEGDTFYMRSSIFGKVPEALGLDGESWLAVPLDGMDELTELGFPMTAEDVTVGDLMAAMTEAETPFESWYQLENNAAELAGVLGDSCFTKSGESYTWDLSAVTGGEETPFAAELAIAPVGERDCAYSLTMEGADSDMTLDFTLTGDTEAMDLDMALHVKNVLKAVVEMTGTFSATTELPQTAPAEGETILSLDEFGLK